MDHADSCNHTAQVDKPHHEQQKHEQKNHQSGKNRILEKDNLLSNRRIYYPGKLGMAMLPNTYSLPIWDGVGAHVMSKFGQKKREYFTLSFMKCS